MDRVSTNKTNNKFTTTGATRTRTIIILRVRARVLALLLALVQVLLRVLVVTHWSTRKKTRDSR